jgi:hypothetical protein
MENQTEKPLPALLNDVIDDATLAALFTDIQACTELLEVMVKSRSMQMTPPHGTWSLDEARELLEQRQVAGIQLRYLYQGSEWWDTILCQPAGWRVVRIRQDFS